MQLRLILFASITLSIIYPLHSMDNNNNSYQIEQRGKEKRQRTQTTLQSYLPSFSYFSNIQWRLLGERILLGTALVGVTCIAICSALNEKKAEAAAAYGTPHTPYVVTIVNSSPRLIPMVNHSQLRADAYRISLTLAQRGHFLTPQEIYEGLTRGVRYL